MTNLSKFQSLYGTPVFWENTSHVFMYKQDTEKEGKESKHVHDDESK